MRSLLFSIVLYIASFQSLVAQKSLVISDKADEYLLTKENIRIYKDASGLLNHKNVLGKEFTLSTIDFEAADFKTSNFWIKFTVKNNSSDQKWLVEVLDLHVQKVGFYDIKNDSLIETGYYETFKPRAYRHKNFVFDISVPSGETRTYLVKVSSSFVFDPAMKIRSNELFITYSNKEYLILGSYYGILILILIYNFLLFISIRDYSYLYYVFFVLTIGLRTLQGDGLGFQYLWPSFPSLNYWLNFTPQLVLISFSAYAIKFLELRKNHSNYYKVILFTVLFYFLFFILGMFVSLKHELLIYLIPFSVIYSVSILVYRNGYKPARFFTVGYSLLILSLTINFLLSLGIRFENEIIWLIIVYNINIGFISEVFTFSIALADKIKLFKNEKEVAQQLIIDQLKINEELKDKVNRELEIKVSERTGELEDAKTKLQEQAKEINKMNQLLDLENYKLKSDAKEINKERGLLKALSFDDFIKTFPDERACYRFIEELKWGDNYACYKCSNSKYIKGKDLFGRKCTKCHYIESIKANTIFHNVKFPVEKAFQLIYLTLITEDEVSTYELARKLDLQQKTCWAFRQKIIDKIKKKQISKKELLEKGWSILITE